MRQNPALSSAAALDAGAVKHAPDLMQVCCLLLRTRQGAGLFGGFSRDAGRAGQQGSMGGPCHRRTSHRRFRRVRLNRHQALPPHPGAPNRSSSGVLCKRAIDGSLCLRRFLELAASSDSGEPSAVERWRALAQAMEVRSLQRCIMTGLQAPVASGLCMISHLLSAGDRIAFVEHGAAER